MATHSSVIAWRIPGTGSLVGCYLWGRTESDTTEATQQQQLCISTWKCKPMKGPISRIISIPTMLNKHSIFKYLWTDVSYLSIIQMKYKPHYNEIYSYQHHESKGCVCLGQCFILCTLCSVWLNKYWLGKLFIIFKRK